MAIYGNLNQLPLGTHGIAESSLLKATISGHLWDTLVCSVDTSGATPVYTPIDVDNGTAVTVLGFTNDDNGLQERYGKIAGVKDKIGFVCTPALVKDARTALEETDPYFYNKAGNDSKVYEVVGDQYDGDIFGVSLDLFTAASQTLAKTRGNYVILDGAGKYVAQAAKPTMANYGFVGQVHSVYTNDYYTLIRIYVIQNEDNNP